MHTEAQTKEATAELALCSASLAGETLHAVSVKGSGFQLRWGLED